jgi:hypothetical protein
MNKAETHSWDFLSDREAQFVDSIARELAAVEWARPLLADINKHGGLTRANKARFFELRFGYALQQAGIAPHYEVQGEGQSTVDFGFSCGGQDWLVELMRLEETQAVKEATHTRVDEDGIPWTGLSLSTNAEKPSQSTEGETLKAVERICQKCERDGRPHKFPAPDGAYHAILVDFRTFINGGDAHDRIHVGLGGEYVQNEFCRLAWDGNLISGVFNERTPSRGATEARARVHFIGFVNEKKFEPGAFAGATQFIANPYLLATATDVRAAIRTWPLQPTIVLNGK